MEGTILNQVVWKEQQGSGEERFTLLSTDREYLLQGTIHTVLDGKPAQVDYQVTCDTHWRTRAVQFDVRTGKAHRQFELSVNRQGGWWMDETEIPRLCGCVDVDIELTPSTNLLPIRRLGLRIGASAEIQVAWVRFPSLTVEPLRQTYTRLSEKVYRYESGNNGFRAEIELDDSGMIVHYGDLWARGEIKE